MSLSLLVVMASCHSAGTATTTTTTTPPAPTIALGSSPSSLAVGQTYQFSATVANETNTAVTWSVSGVTGGNATVGTISASGLYTAPASVPSPQTVTITATSQAASTLTASATLTINIAFSLNVTSATVPVNGTQQFTVTILGTTNTAVTWAVNGTVGGNSVYGTITTTGLYTAPQIPPAGNSVTITATSVAYSSFSGTIAVTLVPPPISVSINPTALFLQTGHTVQFSDMVTTTGATTISTAVTWSETTLGNPGIAYYGTISQTGLYTAPPNVPATEPVPIFVQSQEDLTKYATALVTITTAPVPLQISTATLANGIANNPYSATLSAYGGAQPYAWSITAGALPAGLTLGSATGVISGTPTAAGTFPITVTVTDQTSPTHETANANLSLTIIPQLMISTTTLPIGSVSANYNAALTETGGVAPFIWTITSGALPTGLSLNASTGAITGIPAAGTGSTTGTAYPLTIKLADSGTPQQTQSFSTSLTVYNGPVITTTSPLNTAFVGQAYTATVTAVGGLAPYTWAYTNLPSWLSATPSTGLTSTLSGTPTMAAGPATLTVQITDHNGVQNSVNLSIAVTTVMSFAAPTLPVGVVNTAYNTSGFQLTASGGLAPLTWTSTGTLPPGLTLSSGGLIAGTPTTAGTAYNFTAKVTDSSVPPQVQTQALNIPVYAGLTITTTTLPFGIQNQAYTSTQLTAAGGSGNYTWSITLGSLPAGLLPLPTTGLISGTPTGIGTSNFTVQVTDTTTSQTKQANLSITVAALLIFSAPTPPVGVVGAAYNTSGFQLVASGGQAPLTWTSTGTLPPGLTLSSGGLIAGSPTTAGTSYNFTAKVTDSSVPPQVQTQNLSIPVYTGLTITTTTLPFGIQNQAYPSTQLVAAGGSGNYSWSITSGSLPTGLSPLPTTGLISGTPTGTGTSNFTVQVTDTTTTLTKTANLSITVAALMTFTAPTLPPGVVGTAYSGPLSVSGGTAPYNWTISSGALPSCLSLASAQTATGTNSITGTPVSGCVGGPFNFTVKVTDSAVPAQVQAQAASISIYTGLTITTTTLPFGIQNQAYTSTQLVAAGGSGNYSWSIITGSLPTGLLPLPTTGLISGTPTGTGTSNFTVQVTDTTTTLTKTANLSITVAALLTFTAPTLPSGVVGTAYSGPLSVSGGTAPYNWTISSGALPSCLSLASAQTATGTNSITGTPVSGCVGGPFNFTVKVTDSAIPAQIQAQAASISIYTGLTITTTTLPFGIQNQAYTSTQLVAAGGSGNYSWSIITGSLPTGLLPLPTSGLISGTPTGTGTSNFTVQVTDTTTTLTKTANLSITVAALLTFTAPTLPSGVVGSVYNTSGFQLVASGGQAPLTWTSTGTLPPGVTLSSTGLIAGTPTTAGTAYNFTAKVTDSSVPPQVVSQNLNIPVYTGLTITTTTLPYGLQNQAYNGGLGVQLMAAGGSGNYSWTITSGSLPTGFGALPTSGLISGTATGTGSFSFTVKVTDTTSSQSTTQGLSILITTALTFPTGPLPGGAVGTVYSANLPAPTTGTAPYTYALASGTLPTPLMLNPSTGAITGTPTSAGTFSFNVKVTDSSAPPPAQTQTTGFSISILGVFTSSLPIGNVGVMYNQTLTATGGSGTYTWSITSGALPTCLSLNSATGAITGTPVIGCAGTATFTAQVTDTVTTLTASQALSITIVAGLSITSTSLPSGVNGTFYSTTLTATGGTTPYTWSISSGSLPLWASLNPSTGVISGTPNAVATTSFTVMVTDSTSPTHLTATQPLSITIVSVASTLMISAPTGVSNGNVGQAYSAQLIASGGTGAPYTWSISAGALPACLSLSAMSGVSIFIQGTPVNTCEGSFTFTIQLEDSAADMVTQQFSISINPAGSTVCESGNEAVLTGQYAFSLKGFNSPNVFLAYVGSMTLDGAGNIDSGEADGNAPGATPTNYNVTGTYTLGADNRGCATIRLNGGAFVLNARIVVGSISSGIATAGQIMEYDPVSGHMFIASGPMIQQTTSTTPATSNFSSVSSSTGAYVHLLTGFGGGARIACVGIHTNSFSTNEISNSQEDCNDAGTITSTGPTTGNVGTIGPIDEYGRFTETITAAGNKLAAYTNSTGSQVLAITTEANGGNSIVMTSEATLQQSMTYNNSTFDGNAVYYGTAISGSSAGMAEFGVVNSNGSGTESGTAYANNAGTWQTPSAFSCGYAVGSNGRTTITGTGCDLIFYLGAANTAFFISTDSTVLAGSVGAQTVPGGGFTGAGLNGEAFFGGTTEIVSQSAQSENDFVLFSGGSGANIAGSDISDQSSTSYQAAGQVESISGATIASNGLISQTKDAMQVVQGVAIDTSHYVLVNNSGSNYPAVSVFGPSTADTTVTVTITSPTSPPSVAVNATQAVTVSLTGSAPDIAAGVTWTFNGLAGGSGYGSISGTYPNFTYTAPSSIPSPATFPITVTSNSDVSQSASLTVTIVTGGGPVTVTTGSLPGGTVGVAYNTSGFQLMASGGTTPYTWSITAGSLPLGLSLSTGGLISGTPVAYGAPSFTVEATPAVGTAGTQVLSITVAKSTTGVPNGITVAGNNTSVTGINFALSTLASPTLGLADVGLCTGNPFPCSAGVASVPITHGTSATLWMLGQGLTTSGGAAIPTLSVTVSGTNNDVTVSSVTAQSLTSGLTNITFTVTATSGATPGPRNIIVTNSATGELQEFVGVILIQ